MLQMNVSLNWWMASLSLSWPCRRRERKKNEVRRIERLRDREQCMNEHSHYPSRSNATQRWQSETFTITVDYNCRLKFLAVLNCVPLVVKRALSHQATRQQAFHALIHIQALGRRIFALHATQFRSTIPLFSPAPPFFATFAAQHKILF